jgi:hypothetical protein
MAIRLLEVTIKALMCGHATIDMRCDERVALVVLLGDIRPQARPNERTPCAPNHQAERADMDG